MQVEPDELEAFIAEANEAYPALQATPDEVSMVITGLILFGDAAQAAEEHVFAKRSIVVDHAAAEGLEGLVTAIGVRATTARGTAEQVVDIIARKLDRPVSGCATETTPIFGGNVKSVQALQSEAREAAPPNVDARVMDSLARNYGSQYTRVLNYVAEDSASGCSIGSSHVLAAEVVHSVRQEMAVKLGDVVLRRTDLGTAHAPGAADLRQCAEIMARELGWDPERIDSEIAEVVQFFSRSGSRRDFALLSPA